MVKREPYSFTDKLLFGASVIAGGATWLAFDALKTEPWDLVPFTVPALLGSFAGSALAKDRRV